MNNDRISEVYEGTYGSRMFQDLSRTRVHWMCSQVQGSEVLDVGCSQGITAILLGREGKHVIGVDRERSALESARNRLLEEEELTQERVEFLGAEASALPFPDDRFDTVLMGEVLEHQISIEAPLADVHRVLRPGGRLVITTPYGLLPYVDHKEPLYLHPLLEALSTHYEVKEMTLIDRYLGLIAHKGPASGRRSAVDWRRALALAEERIAKLDRVLLEERNTLSTLRAEEKELRQAGTERDRLAAEVESSRKRVARIEEAINNAHKNEKDVRATLAKERERSARLEGEREGLRSVCSHLEEELSLVRANTVSRAELDVAHDRIARLDEELAAARASLNRLEGLEH